MGSHFAQITTPNPYSLLSGHTPLEEICTCTKHPNSTPKHLFSWKVGKMNYCLGKKDSNWAKCLKSGQNFPRSGKKIYSFVTTTTLDQKTKSGTSRKNLTKHDLSAYADCPLCMHCSLRVWDGWEITMMNFVSRILKSFMILSR